MWLVQFKSTKCLNCSNFLKCNKTKMNRTLHYQLYANSTSGTGGDDTVVKFNALAPKFSICSICSITNEKIQLSSIKMPIFLNDYFRKDFVFVWAIISTL